MSVGGALPGHVGDLLAEFLGNLLAGREPDIVEGSHVVHHAFQGGEATGTTDPARVERDGDVGRLAIETFLPDSAGMSVKGPP